MAGEWIECKLADACSSIDYGLTASASDGEAGPRFLRITDIVSGHIDWKTVPHVVADKQTIKKYRLHDGDIVIARTGASTGVSSYIKNPPDSVFASYLVRLRAAPEYDSHFLAYYLKSDKFWSFIRGALGDKSAQPNASASTMTQAPLRVPRDKDEQQAIARILGVLDDKIELNRRMNETLEAMARAIFKSWFVDFDPVRAKAEGRQPSGMDAATAALFPDSFQDSPLGKIPKGWKVTSLGEEIDSIRGLSYSGKGLAETGFPLHNLDSVLEGGGYKYDGIKRYIGEYQERHIVRPGDLVVTNTEQGFDFLLIGYPAIIPEFYGKVGLYSHHLYRVRPKPLSSIKTHFLYWLLMSQSVRPQIIGCTNGTTVNMLAPDGLERPRFALPTAELIDVFERIAGPLHLRIEANHTESVTLAHLRDALLPKLISGAIRIRDAKRFLEGNNEACRCAHP